MHTRSVDRPTPGLLQAPPSTHALRLFGKRCLDVAGALLLLLLLVPVLLVVALVVRLSSPGPILFRQQRVGQHGKVFWFYKFRTMYHGNDATIHRAYYDQLVRGSAKPVGGAFKLANDPRITPAGRTMRRYSLDELPQLLNVLIGDMSLVGPRPPIPYEVEFYAARELKRLSVRPGLTGLWQVSGRSALTFQEMIELDLRYIADWSFFLDLWILACTPWAIISGRGAC